MDLKEIEFMLDKSKCLEFLVTRDDRDENVGKALIEEDGENKSNCEGNTEVKSEKVELELEDLSKIKISNDGNNNKDKGQSRSRKVSEADEQDNWRLPRSDDNNGNYEPNWNVFRSNKDKAEASAGSDQMNNTGGACGGGGRRLRRYGSGHTGIEDDNSENIGDGDLEEKSSFERNMILKFTNEEPSLNRVIRQPRGPDIGGGIGFSESYRLKSAKELGLDNKENTNSNDTEGSP